MKLRTVLLATTGCLLAAIPCLAANRTSKTTKTSQPVSTAPAAPLTLEQSPAAPPQIIYENGQLTIKASNCTLGDILKEVSTRTGASMDVPGNPADRVVGQFGPGPARDVVSSLLNGTHYNYVLLGSETNSTSLERVILTAKSSAPSSEPTAAPEENAAMYQPPNPMPPGMVRPLQARGMGAGNTVTSQPEDATDDAADAEDTTDDTTDQTDDTTTDATDQTQGDGAAEEQQNGQQNGGVKTPEQLLQELQQQQQQQQQGAPQGLPNGIPTPGGLLPGQAPHN